MTRVLATSSRVAGAALACLVLALTASASASADVRTATATDGPDPTVAFDIAEARVSVDRSSGVLTYNVRFHRPVPTSTKSGLSYLVAWINDADKDACISGTKLGDTYLNVDLGYGGALTARANVKFRTEHVTPPISLAADRQSLQATITDELLKQSNPRCMTVAGSGQATYDPTQPGGGSSYDSVPSVWFDGQAPPPAPPPPAPSYAPPPLPSYTPPQGTATGEPTSTACAKPLMKMAGAEEVAHGSTGQIDVIFDKYDFEHTYDGGAKFVMADAKTGKAFFSEKFGDGMDGFRKGRATFFIDLDPERRPAIVTLTWTQKALDGTVQPCTATLKVKSIHGTRPGFFVRGGSSGELVPRGQRCWEVRGELVTVTINGGGRRARFTRRDACLQWTGKSKNLGAIRVSKNSYGTLDFTSRYAGRAHMTVKVGRRTVLRRTVVSKQKSIPDRRIWEGTDAFFNYCTKGNKELTSSGLRLYCVKPGSYSEAVLFR